ncbi:MAG: MFS transporter [Acidimicrobiia bacterium]|nr:MFS transporter [Acidimicrobiia bacterium]
MRSSIEPLRIRHFRALWTAAVFSNVGSFLHAVAASWAMLELTGSPLWVGLMAASTTLPLLFLALPAGAIADLVDRRRVLLIAQSIMGAAAIAMAVTWYLDIVGPGLLLGLGLVLGVGLALNQPSWQAMVPDLVPRGMVADAVALNSVAFNVARAVGPALGGLLVAVSGPGLAFAINAFSFIGVIAVVFTFRKAAPGDIGDETVGSAIAVGLRYARYTAPFRRLLAIAASFAVTSAVVQSLLPNVTQDALNSGASTYGYLLGAMGVGALGGAFTRSYGLARLGRSMVPLSMTAFGIAGTIVGISRSLALTFVAMLLAGVCWVWSLATLNATVQLMTPQWVRGRAMSLYTFAFVGFLPIGSIVGGALGSVIGAAEAVAAMSIGTVALGLTFARIGIPALGENAPSAPPEDWDTQPHHAHMRGGPVMVINTWVISHHQLEELLGVMNELRQVRLRTGANHWTLYRNADDPHRMSEFMQLATWEDHIRQHHRIDAAAVAVIRRASTFDTSGGPKTRHLVAVPVDPDELPAWEELVSAHDDLHASDGSIPLDAADPVRAGG